MITKPKTNELHELLDQFVDDLGETILAETDQDALDILRPIYLLAHQLVNKMEPILYRFTMKTYRVPFNQEGQPIEHPAGTFQTKPALLVEDVYTVLQDALQLGEYGVTDEQRVLAMTRLLEQIYQKRQLEP